MQIASSGSEQIYSAVQHVFSKDCIRVFLQNFYLHARAMNGSGGCDVWPSLSRGRHLMVLHLCIRACNLCHKNFPHPSSADLTGFKVIPLLHSSFLVVEFFRMSLEKRMLQARMMMTRRSHSHSNQIELNQSVLLPFCSHFENFVSRMGPQNSQRRRSSSTQRLLTPSRVRPVRDKVNYRLISTP